MHNILLFLRIPHAGELDLFSNDVNKVDEVIVHADYSIDFFTGLRSNLVEYDVKKTAE